MIQPTATTAGIAGLVLCGGQSKRMGTDKGLILLDREPWFRRIGSLLISFRLPVFYSIREEQLHSYKQHVNEESLIIDEITSEGPLRGVFTAFKHIDASALLVIACDMPELPASVIESLLQAYANNPHDFYAYQDGEFYQTFPAIYLRRGLNAMPEPRSLQQLLQKGDTCSLIEADPVVFRNFNRLT
ncbi:MAG TPA: molybdenum cofactor guanylyltransferase [Flavitalea sp.]|nr:molybdenum cofactor guanylyltransferase [Flavitalea sp.]